MATHPIKPARIADHAYLVEHAGRGWYRLGFDQLKCRLHYISTQDAREGCKPEIKYDVILMGPVGRALRRSSRNADVGNRFLEGDSLTPNLGKTDETDDIRPGWDYRDSPTCKSLSTSGGFITMMTPRIC